MSPHLTVVRAKPNPQGKDKLGRIAPNTQLTGEWIDVKNTSGVSLNMMNVKIYDHMFNNTCGDEGMRVVYTFPQFTLPAGAIVRIHSGREVPVSTLSFVDRDGANYHAFTNSSYVWNNVCGDVAEVRNASGHLIDRTSYSFRPMEGKVLVRMGQYLI